MKLCILPLLVMAAFGQQQPGPLQGVAGRIPEQSAANAKPTPRLPDGHADLGNAKGSWNPRVVANLAGAGAQASSRSPVDKKIEVPFQPWAKAFYEKNIANLSKDDPEAFCYPPGIPRLNATPFPFQIYQLPDRVIFLYEGGTHIWRVVMMNRPHTPDPNPTFLGDGVGHWEGDTLVIDVIGFNDRTWLDQDGHPHTDALHIIEKYTRTNEMTLQYEVTIDDPKAYTKPWTSSYAIPWAPGAELMEYICNENNTDLNHLVGK
jgi:hypothetical protein